LDHELFDDSVCWRVFVVTFQSELNMQFNNETSKFSKPIDKRHKNLLSSFKFVSPG
jgi:hypothetical protein